MFLKQRNGEATEKVKVSTSNGLSSIRISDEEALEASEKMRKFFGEQFDKVAKKTKKDEEAVGE